MIFIELLDGVNDSWTTVKKARFLYEEICKKIQYDQRFEYGQNKKVLHAIYDREIDIEKDEDPRVICHTSAKIYAQLLERLGIRAKIIYKETKEHRPINVRDVALIFWDEEGNKYYANLVGDIQNCKYGVRTKFFGITKNDYEEAQDVKQIPNDTLKEIDLKLGYIKNDYNDIVFDLLIEEVKNTNNFKKFLQSQGIDVSNMTRTQVLENKMQYLTRLIKFRDKTVGPDEIKKFYKRLFCASSLDKFESKRFRTFEFAKESQDGEVDVISCLEINLENEPVYYVYSEEEQTYVQVFAEDIRGRLEGYTERKGKKLLIDTEEVDVGDR